MITLLLGLAPVAVTLAVVVVVRALDRLREGRRHARILSDLGEPVARSAITTTAREVVTVEGRIAAVEGASDERPRLVSFHPFGTSFLDDVNVYALTHSCSVGVVAVEVDGGGRVLLDGPVQVLRGTIETEHDAPLDLASALDGEPLSGAKLVTRRREGQFRVVHPGDRVRARGAIEPAPDDDALYRASSNVVRMTPAKTDAGESKIVVAATTSRRRRLRPRRGLFWTLGASLVAGGVLAMGAARTDLASRLSARASRLPSATPTPTPSQPPACRAATLAKLARYDIDDRTADACDDPYARAMARFASGDFAAASEAFTAAVDREPALAPSLSEVEAHLFAHAFDRAAAAVRRMVAQFYRGPSTAERRHLDCIVEILEGHARRPPDSSASRFVKVCATRPFVKLARELDSYGAYRGEDDWPRPTYQQETRYDAVHLPYTAVVSTRSRLAARPVALERDILNRMVVSDEPLGPSFGSLGNHFGQDAHAFFPILTTWAAEVVLFYAYAGFPEESAPYWPILDRVAQELEAGRSFHRSWAGASREADEKARDAGRTLLHHVMSVAAAAALYSDDPARMVRYAKLGEPYSAQATLQMSRVVLPASPWEPPVVDRDWPEHKAVFEAALTGSAAEVARVLADQRSSGRSTLPRALAQLRGTDRSPLLRWFRGSAYPAACLTCGASTFLGDVSDRREVARLLGELDEHHRLRPVAGRFTTALTDPELGFELDELETFFSSRR